MRDINKRRWVWWCKAIVTSAVLLAVAAAVLRAARVNYPVKKGHSDDFWFAMTFGKPELHDVELCGQEPYRPRDGRFLYLKKPRVAQWDGWDSDFSTVHYIHKDDCRSPVPEDLLRRARVWHVARPTLHAFYDPALMVVYCWMHRDPEQTDTQWLLRNLQERNEEGARRLELLSRAAAAQIKAEGKDFEDRLRHVRSAWIWQAIVEGIFLSALTLFALWPWLQAKSCHSFAVHLGLTPWLLCLPFWFGYSSGGRIDPLLGTGGVLYPDLLRGLNWLPWTGLDVTAAAHMPNPLSLFSGSPGHTIKFALISKQRIGMVGVGTLAVMIAALVYLLAWCRHVFARLRARRSVNNSPSLPGC